MSVSKLGNQVRDTYRRANGLIGGIVPHSQVRVVQGLFACDALRRIEVEKLLEQVDGKRVRAREQRRERDTRLDRQRTDVVLSLRKQTVAQ